jgi:hypothetical protein
LTAFVIKSTVARTSIGTGNCCSGAAKFVLHNSSLHQLSAAAVVTRARTTKTNAHQKSLSTIIVVACARRSGSKSIICIISPVFRTSAKFSETLRPRCRAVSNTGRSRSHTSNLSKLQPTQHRHHNKAQQVVEVQNACLTYRGSPDKSTPTIRLSSLRVLNMQASSTTSLASSGGIDRAMLRISRTSIIESASFIPRITASR